MAKISFVVPDDLKEWAEQKARAYFGESNRAIGSWLRMKLWEMREAEWSQMPAFPIPTVDEVDRYCRTYDLKSVNPDGFLGYYETIGWVTAKGKPMSDWCGALHAWNYILSGMCWEDVRDLDVNDPRGVMWRDGGQHGEVESGRGAGVAGQDDARDRGI